MNVALGLALCFTFLFAALCLCKTASDADDTAGRMELSPEELRRLVDGWLWAMYHEGDGARRVSVTRRGAA